MRVHVVADAKHKDGGHVVERLTELGGEISYLDRDRLDTYESLRTSSLILLLGSDRSAHEAATAMVVDAETAFVRAALRGGTPVIGICYGAQVIARALGGTSWRAETAEVGWLTITSLDLELCPPGPWAQLHNDAFSLPPGARLLGTSPTAAQGFAFVGERASAIAWQFHPEVTATTYSRWIREGYVDVEGDPGPLIQQTYDNEPRSRLAAHRLTDAALNYLGVELNNPSSGHPIGL